MHTIQPQEHTLYINGMEILIFIPGDMRLHARNRTIYFQLHRIGLPRELMGVLTNHVWADGCLDYYTGYKISPIPDIEPEYQFTRLEGRIAISSYEEKGVSKDILLLNHVHFTLHLR